jgi:hypothetical protein
MLICWLKLGINILKLWPDCLLPVCMYVFYVLFQNSKTTWLFTLFWLVVNVFSNTGHNSCNHCSVIEVCQCLFHGVAVEHQTRNLLSITYIDLCSSSVQQPSWIFYWIFQSSRAPLTYFVKRYRKKVKSQVVCSRHRMLWQTVVC